MTTISKTTFCFTALHRTDEPFVDGPENDATDNALGEALHRSWDGHAVGSIVSLTTVSVPDDKVAAELLALGNDGGFFDDDLDDDLDIDDEAQDDQEVGGPSEVPVLDRDDMGPWDALSECYDVYAAGAWNDTDAQANLDEVMRHLERALGRGDGAPNPA